MKRIRKIANVLMVTVLTILASSQIYAQNFEHQGKGERFDAMCQMLNLTESQQAKMNTLKTDQMKQMLQFSNRLNELKARQQTLTTADKADMKAINANIDEITALKNKMMKQKAKHIQDVRALLTDEQRVIFDSHSQMGERGDGFKNGHKKGNKQGCKGMNREYKEK
ncbi:MAG: periplasmic heavy metal sensor [Chlorobi bacterium]|nr:periplasmic heavy metal sensor [Chlorobiota bacterium]